MSVALHRAMLQNKCYIIDYKVLLEITIIFLNGNSDKNLKVHPSEAMHGAH